MSEPKKGDLRVWYIRNRGLTKYYPANSLDAAWALIQVMASRDLKDDSVFENAFGLEVYSGRTWGEWYSTDGEDIHDFFAGDSGEGED